MDAFRRTPFVLDTPGRADAAFGERAAWATFRAGSNPTERYWRQLQVSADAAPAAPWFDRQARDAFRREGLLTG